MLSLMARRASSGGNCQGVALIEITAHQLGVVASAVGVSGAGQPTGIQRQRQFFEYTRTTCLQRE